MIFHSATAFGLVWALLLPQSAYGLRQTGLEESGARPELAAALTAVNPTTGLLAGGLEADSIEILHQKIVQAMDQPDRLSAIVMEYGGENRFYALIVLALMSAGGEWHWEDPKGLGRLGLAITRAFSLGDQLIAMARSDGASAPEFETDLATAYPTEAALGRSLGIVMRGFSSGDSVPSETQAAILQAEGYYSFEFLALGAKLLAAALPLAPPEDLATAMQADFVDLRNPVTAVRLLPVTSLLEGLAGRVVGNIPSQHPYWKPRMFTAAGLEVAGVESDLSAVLSALSVAQSELELAIAESDGDNQGPIQEANRRMLLAKERFFTARQRAIDVLRGAAHHARTQAELNTFEYVGTDLGVGSGLVDDWNNRAEHLEARVRVIEAMVLAAGLEGGIAADLRGLVRPDWAAAPSEFGEFAFERDAGPSFVFQGSDGRLMTHFHREAQMDLDVGLAVEFSLEGSQVSGIGRVFVEPGTDHRWSALKQAGVSRPYLELDERVTSPERLSEWREEILRWIRGRGRELARLSREPLGYVWASSVTPGGEGMHQFFRVDSFGPDGSATVEYTGPLTGTVAYRRVDSDVGSAAAAVAEAAEDDRSGVVVLGPSAFNVPGMRDAVAALQAQPKFQNRFLLLPREWGGDPMERISTLLDPYRGRAVGFQLYTQQADSVADEFFSIANQQNFPVYRRGDLSDLNALLRSILENLGVVEAPEAIETFLQQFAGLEIAA
ncbi:MAG: hypothetical protein COV76_00890 [Candidatus Omnitrophica bacterium CG11_big_fil_rev_8_21_14_0_20_64_10]|nr:MAG: hypothetical protein COV76_00890 [Candidatus Omnitrophica bacterium CG11_big_fil_rev_8_21_14_0_20_64_10]